MTSGEMGRVIGRIGPKESVWLRCEAVAWNAETGTYDGETAEAKILVEVLCQRGEGEERECLVETDVGDQAWVEAGCIDW